MDVQQCSEDWLKEYGLEANGLSLSQILSSLGFKQCAGEVECLGQSVTSQYGAGLFLQHPDHTGQVYNLVDANEDKLQQLEVKLTAVIESLKHRLQWLNTGSRKLCGVLRERRVLMLLIESNTSHKSRRSPVEAVAIGLLQEQGSYLTHLNIIRGTSSWKQCLVKVHEEDLREAVQWMVSSPPSPTTSSPTMEAGTDDQVEAIYMIVEGNEMLDGFTDIAEKVKQSSSLVHVVIVNCMNHALLESCQKLALACGGRCHAEGVNEGALCLPRPDVMLLWGELEQARDVLAQVQALHMEVAESIRAYKTTEPDPSQCSVHRETGSRKPAVRTPMKAPRGSSTGKSSTTAAHTSAQERNKRGTLSTTHSKTRCKARAPIRYNDCRSKHKTEPAIAQVIQSRPKLMGVPKGSTVLACCKQDGFYYKGRVVRSVSRRRVEVKFLDSECQVMSVSELMVVGGAMPRPELSVYDHVLCCVRQKQGMHCSEFGVCDFYIPGQVQEVPSHHGLKLFIVSTFDGEYVSCPRSGLEKISESRYHAICNSITKRYQSQTVGSALADMPSTTEHLSKPAVDSITEHGSLFGSAVADNETSAHTTPEREMAATQHPETQEKGTSMLISTQDQGVGTGPLMVDHGTTTEHRLANMEQDEIDYPDSPALETGSIVFCCLPGGGQFHKATILGRGTTPSSWNVRAESGEISDIIVSHIITTSSPNIMHEGVSAMAPHPLFPANFAPGTATSTQSSTCSILFYDDTQADIPRHEVHVICPNQHQTAVSVLQERDKCWVGQVVVARRDSDGVYYPATVIEQLKKQCYQIQWSDSSEETQTLLHMFGPLTVRRPLNAGDHVLALAMAGIGACLPGTVTATQTRDDTVDVKFSDGERQTVRKKQCFWISPSYFMSAVEYISTVFSHNYPS